MVSSNTSSSSSSYESEEEFRRYFHNLVDEILDPLVSKAREYGTLELEQLGGVFRTTQGFSSAGAKENLQVATWFYAQGKAARWTAAVRRGEAPSTDTVLDLMVYCMMYLKITETGEWWTEQPKEMASEALRGVSVDPLVPRPQSGPWNSPEYKEGRSPRKLNPSVNLED